MDIIGLLFKAVFVLGSVLREGCLASVQFPHGATRAVPAPLRSVLPAVC